MFKAVVFDIGQTLVEYRIPLNWSRLYRPAFGHVAEQLGYEFAEAHFQCAHSVLTKYNTRVNPRDYEVSSTQIFTEILSGMEVPMQDLEQVRACFYSYFRQDAVIFPEAERTLQILSDRGILLGTLSDVAYGMDNVYALEDIAPLRRYIDYPLTSNDVGFRKPRPEGLRLLSEKMKVDISELIFVGDEQKDMRCAANAGAYAVLINRDNAVKNYGQDREIASLEELTDILDTQVQEMTSKEMRHYMSERENSK